MSLIKVQNMTPEIYTQESRDFQLLCRLYDCVLNGVKFDIDTIPSLVNTKDCRNDILQLLATKIGFFTDKKFDDTVMRYVLDSFPTIIRNKGSLLSVKETIYMFLRLHSVPSDIEIYYLKTPYSSPFSETEPCILNTGKMPKPHSLLIRIKSFKKRPDTTVIDEVFRYIIPAGIHYYIEFSTTINLPDLNVQPENEGRLLFVSDNINSQLRGPDQHFLELYYTSNYDEQFQFTDLLDDPDNPFGLDYNEEEKSIESLDTDIYYEDQSICIPCNEESGIGFNKVITDRSKNGNGGFMNRAIGMVNTMELISSDKNQKEVIDSYINPLFLGYYRTEDDANSQINKIVPEKRENSVAIINYTYDKPDDDIFYKLSDESINAIEVDGLEYSASNEAIVAIDRATYIGSKSAIELINGEDVITKPTIIQKNTIVAEDVDGISYDKPNKSIVFDEVEEISYQIEEKNMTMDNSGISFDDSAEEDSSDEPDGEGKDMSSNLRNLKVISKAMIYINDAWYQIKFAGYLPDTENESDITNILLNSGVHVKIGSLLMYGREFRIYNGSTWVVNDKARYVLQRYNLND